MQVLSMLGHTISVIWTQRLSTNPVRPPVGLYPLKTRKITSVYTTSNPTHPIATLVIPTTGTSRREKHPPPTVMLVGC